MAANEHPEDFEGELEPYESDPVDIPDEILYGDAPLSDFQDGGYVGDSTRSGPNFYRRTNNTPVVQGRPVKMSAQCKICKLVPELINLGHSMREAEKAEEDLYRMVYAFYEATEISRWLLEYHGYDAAHDSVSRHIKNHISDPRVEMIKRVQSYRPKITRRAFEGAMLDTARYTLFQFREDMVNGAVEIKPNHFIALMEKYREWVEEFDDSVEDTLMNSLKQTIERVITDPRQQQQFREVFREELEKQESEEE